MKTGEPELVWDGLHFPTSLAFDDEGVAYVAESGLPFGGAPPGGRVWRLGASGERTLLADGFSAPVNGLTCYDGSLIVSEAGPPGRITRLTRHGGQEQILAGLPGPGNYHTNMAVVGPDGWLYFSQGAMANTAVVGLDAFELAWLGRLPHHHDIPGLDITLAGFNAQTPDPLAADGPGSPTALTGAFRPFGQPTRAGERITAQVPCTAAVMRCRLDGSGLETVGWGLRNAFGLGFLPDGRLLAVDQGADDRGSRPLGNVPDLLFEVRLDGRVGWYGWPDFVDGVPVTDPSFTPQRGPAPAFVLANHTELPSPERALLRFPPHAAAVKFAAAPQEWGRPAGQVFVALFGDERPMTAPPGPRVGRSIHAIDPVDWSMEQVVASQLARPIDVAFHPGDGSLYVLDFGRFEMVPGGLEAGPGSGGIWRMPAPSPVSDPPAVMAREEGVGPT